jgi:hypothetical protein
MYKIPQFSSFTGWTGFSSRSAKYKKYRFFTYQKNMSSEYYHKVLKMTALEIWKKDSRRIDEIFDFFKGKVNVIVVWEGSNIGLENFSNLINNLNNIKTKLEL